MEVKPPAQTDQDLVLVFMPALAPLLMEAEDLKGSPLSHDEVLRIRDHAVCVTMPRDVARAVAESRGYEDLSRDNCWHDWQALRQELGQKPEKPDSAGQGSECP